ncbi:MAG: arginine--tRNA ligase [Flavobacteriales bacterium]|nr:arginine--tRNA ligase [Flavobacteriales bacterium]
MTEILKSASAEILNTLFSEKLNQDNRFTSADFLINTPPADFPGDLTVVLFPVAKRVSASPVDLGNALGEALMKRFSELASFEVVKGFLNLTYADSYRLQVFNNVYASIDTLWQKPLPGAEAVMVEYPSPNTNKPLHLGHLRNVFLGHSLSRILEADGKKVIPVCLFNDRGVHICKSMVARQKFMPNETPASTGMKPDKFVGECYVKFSNAYKEEVDALVATGISKEVAEKQAPLQKEVEAMLIQWEENDPAVRALWSEMNGWCYEGMQVTFDRLGISFEKKYYESEIYNIGKETVNEGLEKGVFYTREDGSVWVNLTDCGLDEKVVLRANGTSIYITQDIAIAYQKQKDFEFNQSVYVVGNEQDYHFKVLFEILKRLGMKAADKLFHLSYGMVELPTGKMKSREGKVVDADDLLDEMVEIARQKAEYAGKTGDFTGEEKQELFRQIGYGALRYFILKVDPKKKMIFNPEESIDMQGNTGPFIQYTHARCRSLLRKAGSVGNSYGGYIPLDKEWKIVRRIAELPELIKMASKQMDPSSLAAFSFETAKEFNQFYQEISILNEGSEDARNFRLMLTDLTAKALKKSLYLLGIEAPERM